MQKQIKKKTSFLLFFFILLVNALTFSSVLGAVEISDGTVKGLWHFNGDSTDASGNGANGTDTDISYETGKLGSGSADFNGTTSYISLPNTSLEVNGGDYSVTGWVYLDANDGSDGQTLISKRTASPDNTELSAEIQDYGAAPYYPGIYNGTAEYKCTNTTVTTGQWVHLVFIINQGAGRDLRCYRNGTLTDTISLNEDFETTTNGEVSIGRAGGIAGNYFDGNFDEIAVIFAQLSTSTITALYNNGNGDEICTSVGCASSSPSITATSSMAEETLSFTYALLNLFLISGTAFIIYKIIRK